MWRFITANVFCLCVFQIVLFGEKLLNEEDFPVFGKKIPYLNEIMNGSINNIPNIEIDPWNYLHRQMLNILIMKHTENHCLWNNNINNLYNISHLHPFWGFVGQLSWQFESKRLFNNKYKINKKSWWGNMNYMFSIIPFLSLQSLNIANNIQIIDESNEYYCNNYNDCNQYYDVIKIWKEFFILIYKTFNTCDQTNNKLLLDKILQLQWNAHVLSMSTGLNKFKSKLNYLPTIERKFAQSWALTVDYLALISFPTNYENYHCMIKILPHRILNDNSDLNMIGFINDFSSQQNKFIQLIVNYIYYLHSMFSHLLLNSVKFASSTIMGKEIILSSYQCNNENNLEIFHDNLMWEIVWNFVCACFFSLVRMFCVSCASICPV